MAVKDNQPFLYYSTSETSVKNSSEEGERSEGMHQSSYKYKNILLIRYQRFVSHLTLFLFDNHKHAITK